VTLVLQYKGFNYTSYYNGAYEDADSLVALAQTGANAVALNLQYGIDSVASIAYADPNYTDSLDALASTIQEALGYGLSVMVRPLIDFVDPDRNPEYNPGDWRAYFNPSDFDSFFATYKQIVLDNAEVAQANGAQLLCIGAEIDQLCGPDYLDAWTDIIRSVRAVYTGGLTYAANWNSDISPWQGQHGLPAGTGDIATQISFWDQLDYVGIDCYAPISDAADPTLDDLVAGWTDTPTDLTSAAVTGELTLVAYFQSVAARIGIPLLFTELGYESATDAASQPFGSATNVFDPMLQASLYQAFFQAWQEADDGSLVGLYLWNWDPNAAEVGPDSGANFSPQGLPAQAVIAARFLAAAPGGIAE
jgi:GTA TIM-barrel-like domain